MIKIDINSGYLDCEVEEYCYLFFAYGGIGKKNEFLLLGRFSKFVVASLPIPSYCMFVICLAHMSKAACLLNHISHVSE